MGGARLVSEASAPFPVSVHGQNEYAFFLIANIFAAPPPLRLPVYLVDIDDWRVIYHSVVSSVACVINVTSTCCRSYRPFRI